MRRALELGGQARGRTSPNPMVGAVIVKGERVVGEGYHARAGEKHAEICALEKAGTRARGGDLYVNLEPCSHTGRTPPCTRSIIDAGVHRVFAAIRDPNPHVAGNGGAQLRRAGISVRFGLAAREARQLNEPYLKHIRTGIPFVLLKTGMSLDGKTATRTRESRWITSEPAREKVHELRDSVDAIIVGIGTILADDPSLTTRLPGGGGKDPDRIVIDGLLRIPSKARVLARRDRSKTILVTTPRAPKERIRQFRDLGAEVLVIEGEGARVDMRRLVKELGARGMTSVMIEGGSEINASALEAGIVDKVVFFIAPKIIGGRDAPTAVGGDGISSLQAAQLLKGVRFLPLGDNLMIEGYLSGEEV